MRPSPFLLGLAGFCLVNSAIYTLNDLCDAAADRLHPTKRRRPIAAGEVSKRAAAVQIAVLLLAGLGLCLAADRPPAVAIVLSYVAINAAYNLGAKHVTLLDVFLLSSGFVIRVLLGCALVSAAAVAVVAAVHGHAGAVPGFCQAAGRPDRGTGPEPSPQPPRLQQGIPRPGGGDLRRRGPGELCAVLHRSEDRESVLQPGREMASMPFVAYGILNYLRMVYVEGAGGSPVAVAYRSVSTQICAVGWIAAVTWSLGLW